jgi:hypothetical protein
MGTFIQPNHQLDHLSSIGGVDGESLQIYSMQHFLPKKKLLSMFACMTYSYLYSYL